MNTTYRAAGSDFLGYYTGALLVAHGKGDLLYTEAAQKEYQLPLIKNISTQFLPFRYLPFVALLFLPFLPLSLTQAYFSFAIITCLLVMVFFLLAKNIFYQVHRQALLSVSLLYPPLIGSMLLGQPSLLVALVILLLYLLYKKQRFFLMGILTGLILIKLQFIFLIPLLLLLVKKRQYFIGVLVSMAGLVILNSFVMHPNHFLSYFSFIEKTNSPAYGSSYWHSFTLYATLSDLPFHLTQMQLIILNLLGYGLSCFYLWKKSKTKSFDELFIAACLATVIFSMHFHIYDLFFLTIPLFILLKIMSKKKKIYKTKYFWVALLIFFIPIGILFKTVTWTSPLLLVTGWLLLRGD